jgi:hypothetical protein
MWAAEQRHADAVEVCSPQGGSGDGVRSRGLPQNYMAPRVNVRAVERRASAGPRAAAGRTYEAQVDARTPRSARGGFDPAAGRSTRCRRMTTRSCRRDWWERAAAVSRRWSSPHARATSRLRGAARTRGANRSDDRVRLDSAADGDQQPQLRAREDAHRARRRRQPGEQGRWTPLYLATDNRNIEGGDYPVPKPDLDHLEIIRRCWQHGANPNARVHDNTLTRTIFTMQWFFEDGATPFVRAAQSSDTELMKLLLEYKADPFIKTANGDTR